jgi:rare lipoprotein A (peptidoglycan hydrolase)
VPGAAHLRTPDRAADATGDAVEEPRVERHRLAFAMASTFAALPILVVDNLPVAADDGGATEQAVLIETTGPDAPVELPASTTVAPTTTEATTTSAAPTTTEATTTTLAPTTTVPPTTAPPPPPTTAAPTTAPPPPPTTAAPEPEVATASESGQATWYRQPPRYAPGGCAHKTLPFGTQVTITAHHNGATATCTVNDRGPFGPGRIIDLDDDVFVQLAPLSTGVIDVTITW